MGSPLTGRTFCLNCIVLHNHNIFFKKYTYVYLFMLFCCLLHLRCDGLFHLLTTSHSPLPLPSFLLMLPLSSPHWPWTCLARGTWADKYAVSRQKIMMSLCGTAPTLGLHALNSGRCSNLAAEWEATEPSRALSYSLHGMWATNQCLKSHWARPLFVLLPTSCFTVRLSPPSAPTLPTAASSWICSAHWTPSANWQARQWLPRARSSDASRLFPGDGLL